MTEEQLLQALRAYLANPSPDSSNNERGPIYQLMYIVQTAVGEVADPGCGKGEASDEMLAYYVNGQIDCILEEIESTQEHER